MKTYVYGREHNIAIQRFIYRQAELLPAKIRDRKYSLKTERQNYNANKQIDERAQEKWRRNKIWKKARNLHFH